MRLDQRKYLWSIEMYPFLLSAFYLHHLATSDTFSHRLQWFEVSILIPENLD